MTERKEILHIYGATGEQVAECDLASARDSRMVVLEGGVPAVTECAAAGAEVLGALVRDDDGWTLAAADPARPVRSGAKAMPDAHLVPGLPCRLADFVFRLERSSEDSGDALVWRYDGSPFVADPVMGGRNVVGFERGAKQPVLNPVLTDEVLFELYPTAEGLDVETSSSSSDRLSVPRGALFSVGGFSGMLMSSRDAAVAMRSSDPFAWPSRSIRRRLLVAIMLISGVFAFGVMLFLSATRLERLAAEPRGATEVAWVEVGEKISYDDVIVYNLMFYQMIPTILTAEPNASTLDLIQRGEQLTGIDSNVVRKVKFLRDVRAIQESILTGRWDMFKRTYANADREFFRICDAETFLKDADVVADFLTEKVPRHYVEASERGRSRDLAVRLRSLDGFFENMQSNMFMSGVVLQRERDSLVVRSQALLEYVAARDDVLDSAATNGLTAAKMDRLYESCLVIGSAFDVSGTDELVYNRFAARENPILLELVSNVVSRVVASGDRAGGEAAVLEPTALLAQDLGIPSAQTEEWLRLARLARRRLQARYRELYSTYRVQERKDPAAAEKILDDMLALGDDQNNFHAWAVREKAARAKTATGKETER